jgi:hypothetical protein
LGVGWGWEWAGGRVCVRGVHWWGRVKRNMRGARRALARADESMRARHVWMMGGARTLSMFGGMALPPTPMRRQSMKSPSSRNDSRPTTTPFSDATTVGVWVGGRGRNGCEVGGMKLGRQAADMA